MNHVIQISISHCRWFDTQKQMAEFLGIKNSSKKAIQTRCKVFGYEVEFRSQREMKNGIITNKWNLIDENGRIEAQCFANSLWEAVRYFEDADLDVSVESVVLAHTCYTDKKDKNP